MNVSYSLKLVEELMALGVKDFCLCPGGRNAPLVKALHLFAEDINIYSFYDERVAAFFALGKIKATKHPVAVVTTSGSAVANLIPASVEAHYNQLPFILVTADRPKNYRGKGSPQAIEQVGIFSHYIETTYDLSVGDSFFLQPPRRPLHINICYDEPLLADFASAKNGFTKPQKSQVCSEMAPLVINREQINEKNGEEVMLAFIRTAYSPLVLLGPGVEARKAKPYLLKWQLPIYAEAGSGLREDSELQHLLLQGGEGFLMQQGVLASFDSVIRIGPVPTVRLWRDLEFALNHWPVLNFSEQPFSGLSRAETEPFGLNLLERLSIANSDITSINKLVRASRLWQQQLEDLFIRYPLAEPSLIKDLSLWLPPQAQIFLGNSLPIREWDLAATRDDKGFAIQCNRGANGIDGLLSTAMGWAQQGKSSYCLLGDLSALYDMNAFQALPHCAGQFHTVIINNGGGKIFSPLFNDPAFENRHQLKFAPLAQMFGLNYLLLEEPINWPNKILTQHTLLEVIPNNEQSDLFHKAYAELSLKMS